MVIGMRIGIFVDGLTLYKSMDGRKIPFNRLYEWIRQDDEVTYAGYFTCVNNTEGKKSFLQHVFKSGFELFIRQPLYNRNTEKYIMHGTEVEMSIEAIHNMDKFDKFVMVGGKHNFLPLCEKMTMNGKQVEIIGAKEGINEVYNKYPMRYMDEFFEELDAFENDDFE